MFTDNEINMLIVMLVFAGSLILFVLTIALCIRHSIKKDNERIRRENRDHMEKMQNLYVW